MKTLEQALRIIKGSKQYEFEEGSNGDTVLVIIDYYTGATLKLDLACIDEDILGALQAEDEFEDEE